MGVNNDTHACHAPDRTLVNMTDERQKLAAAMQSLVRLVSAGSGLSVEAVARFGQPHPEDVAELTATCVKLMPTSPQKLAIIAALNLGFDDEGSDKLEVRRARVMQEMDVSYSTVIRLERTAATEIATIAGTLLASELPWDELAPQLQGRIFAIQNERVVLWPDWVEPELYGR